MSAKCLVIGVDGGTWNVFEPMIAKGILSNISRMMKEGSYGSLKSTYPPVSSTAWASFMTGKNPCKHGVFNFNVKPQGTYYLEPVIHTDIKGPTLWEYLTCLNKRVAVINMPMTYPPLPINGIMISGLGTPLSSEKYTYPDSILDEIKFNMGGFIKDVFWTNYHDNEIERFIVDLSNMTENHYRVASYFIEKEEWDLFTFVFVGSDRLFHRLWGYINDDKLEQKYSNLIEQYFLRIDEMIGCLMDKAGDEANTIILSDHGFGPFLKKVKLNNWLKENGYLSLRTNTEYSLVNLVKVFLKWMGFDRRRLEELLRGFGLKIDLYKHLEKTSSVLGSIDWDNTRAFSYSCNSVYINLKGRERNGIVEPGGEYERLCSEIEERLYSLCDPDSGQKLIYKIKRKDEIYSGDFIESAPDLIITDYDERYWFCYWGKEGMCLSDKSSEIFESAPCHTGQHSIDGIYITHGKAFKENNRYDRPSIMDFFPTISALLGLPVPNDIDGRVLVEIMKECPITKETDIQTKPTNISENYEMSEKEKEEIKKQLRRLGYLG